MNYKGYIGQIEFDDEQHIFTGCVINTRAVITFQGASIEELETAFKESVEEYLAWCKEDGVELEKPHSVSIGNCAQASDMTEEEFITIPGQNRIDLFHYESDEELMRDIANA